MIDIQPDLTVHDDVAMAKGLLRSATAAAMARGLPPVEGSGLGLRDGDATLVVWVEMGGRRLESEVNLMVLGRLPADRRDALVAEMAGALADEWGLTLAGEI
ncbi:MAG TPA: hypothetical protein VMZ50_14225 [Phycisphaerae bacterium]|nr:hypothetical protein [Phycisphaerae bacterium]